MDKLPWHTANKWPARISRSILARYRLASDQILKSLAFPHKMDATLVNQHLRRQWLGVVIAPHDRTVGPREADDQKVSHARRGKFARTDITPRFLSKDISRFAERPTDNDLTQLL
jgi:hypothetical protein